MDNRFNTIAGWVLFSGVVILLASTVAGEMFMSERPETMGYPIPGVVAKSEAGAAAAEMPIEAALAAADPAKGQQVFNKCMSCHNAEKGGPNQIGPNLWGVVGEPIGKGKGFPFSPALAGKGGNWDWTTLSEWLKSPRDFAPGTKMTFAGLSSVKDRADLIAFLNARSDAPKPLPTAQAAGAPGPAGAKSGGTPAAQVSEKESAPAAVPAGSKD